jgi:hypothetical protein
MSDATKPSQAPVASPLCPLCRQPCEVLFSQPGLMRYVCHDCDHRPGKKLVWERWSKPWPSEFPLNDPRNTCGAY